MGGGGAGTRRARRIRMAPFHCAPACCRILGNRRRHGLLAAACVAWIAHAARVCLRPGPATARRARSAGLRGECGTRAARRSIGAGRAARSSKQPRSVIIGGCDTRRCDPLLSHIISCLGARYDRRACRVWHWGCALRCEVLPGGRVSVEGAVAAFRQAQGTLRCEGGKGGGVGGGSREGK